MEQTIILDFCEKCEGKGFYHCQCGQACESKNHRKCYDYDDEKAILWQCSKCQQWSCFADGMANNSLCDSCNKNVMEVKSFIEKLVFVVFPLIKIKLNIIGE